MLSCLLVGLDYGIVIGIVVNMAFVLYATARPAIQVRPTKVANQTVLLVVPDQSLVFSAAEHLRYKVLKHAAPSPLPVEDGDEEEATKPPATIIVLDGSAVTSIDVTVAEHLQLLANDLRARHQTLLFWNWPRQPTDVAWRHSAQLGALFHEADTLAILMETAGVNCYLR